MRRTELRDSVLPRKAKGDQEASVESENALHSPCIDPIEGDEATWPGEAKIAGRAVHAGAIEADGAPPGELFIAGISEVVVVHLDGSGMKLVVEWWTPDAGLRRVERD